MVVWLLARRAVHHVSKKLSKLRIGKIVLVLFVYSFGGAAIFCVVELNMSTATDLEFGSGCLAAQNLTYWASLNYVNTLYSSMGYGEVYCCTWLGRLLTCIFIFFGVPIFLIVLEALGKTLTTLCSQMWTIASRCARFARKFSIKRAMMDIWGQRKSASSNGIWKGRKFDTAWVEEGKKDAEQKQVESKKEDEEEELPLSVGLSLSCVWMLLIATYFCLMEGWTYGESVYFVWISIMTVGLGDFAPTRYEYTIINYALLFIGVAMLSMCITILQDKIAGIIQKSQAEMQRRRNNLGLGGNDVESDSKTPAHEETKKFAKFLSNLTGTNPEVILSKVMGTNKEELLLKMVMTSNQREMVEGRDKISMSLHNSATQTIIHLEETETQTFVDLEETETQTIVDSEETETQTSVNLVDSETQMSISLANHVTQTGSPAVAKPVGLCEKHSRYLHFSDSERLILVDSKEPEALFTIAGDNARNQEGLSSTDNCIICRALKDLTTPKLPPPPVKPPTPPLVKKPRSKSIWEMTNGHWEPTEPNKDNEKPSSSPVKRTTPSLV